LVTKRYVGVVFAALLALPVAGCAVAGSADRADPAALAAAIDAYLTDHPEPVCTAPLFLPYDERADGREDPALRSSRREDLRWLEGLAAAGMLIKARTTARGTAASGPTPVDEYALSADGRREVEDARRVDLGSPARFCIALTRVGTVVGITPLNDRTGVRGALVRYRPALAKRAAWWTRSRTKSALPWLTEWANAQLGERRVKLRQTASGWIVL
jgi:hypothetical protein